MGALTEDDEESENSAVAAHINKPDIFANGYTYATTTNTSIVGECPHTSFAAPRVTACAAYVLDAQAERFPGMSLEERIQNLLTMLKNERKHLCIRMNHP